MFDYSLLNGKIVEKCGTQANFAERMSLSERSISLKLNNKVPWGQSEMINAVKVLEMERQDIPALFFTPIVQKVEL